MSAVSRSTPLSSVHIIGSGLLGTSIGMALTEQGVPVSLEDASPTRVALAVDYGAGQALARKDIDPALVVVATPPDVTAQVVHQALTEFPTSVVLDVASVKGSILEDLQRREADLSRYVGTHPMAGRERGGPTAARVDLFTGRPWVVCENPSNAPETIRMVRDFIESLGATAHFMNADEHDGAVAAISHLPQVVSSLLASTLHQASSPALDLAGQGVRDATRIAASDPQLWSQILSHNAPIVGQLLEKFGEEALSLARALSDLDQPGAKAKLTRALESGNDGVARLPGKHGVSARFVSLTVVIDDTPGQLAALLTDVGNMGVNLEDMRLEHSPGATVGFVELSVTPDAVGVLNQQLVERGWRIAGEVS